MKSLNSRFVRLSLESFARRAGAQPSEACTIDQSFVVDLNPGRLECTPADDWCVACSDILIDIAIAKGIGCDQEAAPSSRPDPDADSPLRCKCCGVMVDYNLTQDGARAELKLLASLDPDAWTATDAYRMSRIIAALPYERDVAGFGHDMLNRLRFNKKAARATVHAPTTAQ